MRQDRDSFGAGLVSDPQVLSLLPFRKFNVFLLKILVNGGGVLGRWPASQESVLLIVFLRFLEGCLV